MNIINRYTFPKCKWSYKGYIVSSEIIDKEYDEIEKGVRYGFKKEKNI